MGAVAECRWGLAALKNNDTWKTFEPWHDKTNKMSVRPAKTQISLGICPVWSESLLCAQWVAKGPRFLHADSKDSDQTRRMPRLIGVFVGCTLTLLILSCRGSLCNYPKTWLMWFYHRVMHPKDTERMANSEGPAEEQSDLGLHCLTWQTCLYKHLGLEQLSRNTIKPTKWL